MKKIKKFNDYNKLDEGVFGKKHSLRDLHKKNNIDIPDFKIGVLLMDAEPYDKSTFGQLKYRVYLKNVSKGIYYYLGDLREFVKSDSPDRYLSYLQLDKIHIEEPKGLLISVNPEAERLIQSELDMVSLHRNLSDEMPTYREEIEKKCGVKINNPIY